MPEKPAVDDLWVNLAVGWGIIPDHKGAFIAIAGWGRTVKKRIHILPA